MELKDVRAQLADTEKENKRLRRGIFRKCLNELRKKSSTRKSTNRVMSVGMLTGRPAEEMPGSTGDLLPELSQLPEGLGELAEKLKGARRRFRLWKISACQRGAREAWAMVKT